MCAFVRPEDHLSLMPQVLPLTPFYVLISRRSLLSSLFTNSYTPAGYAAGPGR
jgi:hypothetical protein